MEVVCAQLDTPAAVPPGKSRGYPVNRRMGWLQRWSVRFESTCKYLVPTENRTMVPWASSHYRNVSADPLGSAEHTLGTTDIT